jgi:hypothetical protein
MRRCAKTAAPANGWIGWSTGAPSQESRLAEAEQLENWHKTLFEALTVLSDREREIFESRRLAEERPLWRNSPADSASPASVCARSRPAPSKRCEKRRRTLPPPWNDRYQSTCLGGPGSAAHRLRIAGEGRRKGRVCPRAAPHPGHNQVNQHKNRTLETIAVFRKTFTNILPGRTGRRCCRDSLDPES